MTDSNASGGQPASRELTGETVMSNRPSVGRQFAEPHPSPDEVQFTNVNEPKPRQLDANGVPLNYADRTDHIDYALPRSTEPMRLNTVLSSQENDRIRRAGYITFQMAGDTGGVVKPSPQLAVADRMEQDFKGPEASRPAFFYHLGDVVYYFGQRRYYNAQFYYPNRNYPGPIFAIAGNHDGDIFEGESTAVPLEAFLDNFCSAEGPINLPEARPYRRTAMDQPGVYFELDTDYAKIIGLYTNISESVGVLYPAEQLIWFKNRLDAARSARSEGDGRAVIVALHHPALSADGESGGGNALLAQIEHVTGLSGFVPDIFFCGHVHNYQRFTRTIGGQPVPFVVAGNGGYHNLTAMQKQPGGSRIHTPFRRRVFPEDKEPTSLDFHDDQHYGYLRVTVTPAYITSEYIPVANKIGEPIPESTPTDRFTLDYVNHRLTAVQLP